MLSELHHGEEKTDERLSAAELRKHGEKIGGFIDCAAWAQTAAWQQFMSDVAVLADGMEKLAAAMTKTAAANRAGRQQAEPPRAPDREEDVEGSGLKEASGPGGCADKYVVLRARLAKLADYELLHLDDDVKEEEGSSTRVFERERGGGGGDSAR